MAEVGVEESKFSHLSSEQRESLANQGRDFVSRRRQKQLRGEKESADWTAAVQSEVEKRLGELNESHEREIEDVRAKGEEEKSRELSLLSEELTKQYKYHVEQLEARLQLSNESSGSDEVAVGGEFAAYKRRVEQQASEQVQQYYQQYRAEVEQLQAEVDRISEERDVALESERQLISRVEGLETRSAAVGRSGDWERERVSLLQRLQEAEKGREVDTLVVEREENREILASREKEKLVYSMDGARILETESFLFQVRKVRKELKAKFLRSHQILQQREAALMSELDQLVASYKGEAIKEQIRDLNQMKETLKSSVQRKENQEIAVKSLEPMNNRIRELGIRLGTVFGEMRGVELNWDRKLEERLSKLGEINVITAQALEEFSGSLNYYDTRIYDLRSREKYFRNYRDKTRTVSFPHPHYYCSTCMEKNGLKIQCGHFICPDCLLDLVWYQILNIKPGFFCPVCPRILSIEDIIKFGLPTEDEKQFIMTALSVNFCESQDIVQCPNCSSYCQRMNSECPRMECTVCAMKGKKNTFCWYCLRGWKKVSKYQDSCGNGNCRRKDFEALRNCPKEIRKRYAGELITIPTLRACPHCFTIVEYVKGSYHVDCRNCSKIFCFICLEKEIDGAMLCISYKKITCWTAPVQIKLRLLTY